jgi:hypothetical protein
MSDADALLSALSSITGTGNFHAAGSAPFFLPGLQVKGLGELAFPLPASQAKELAALAEAAPYGMGEQTVVDEKVRKCWQLDASLFSIKSPEWKKFLKQTVDRIREDLGIKGKVSALPYKLLLYGKGGHFRAHRDTEKLDAMFGTLIVALPSAHEGGRLFIRHDGREIEVDFSQEAHRHEFQHAAFFADCEHEVEPVRSGYRCCLVYNLRLDEGNPDSLNLPLDAHARTLLAPLSALMNGTHGELSALLLEHGYTEANLSLRNLKGNDQARAQAFFAAAKEAGFVAHLGLVTYHQSGELEESGYRGRRKHWDDDDDDDSADGTMGEIHEESLTIDHWRDGRDRRVVLGSYRIDDDVILSAEPLGNGEPDQKEAEGYTGNAGCTMDYWYRRAAIVLWAKEDQEAILCQYNFTGACQTLADLAGGKKTGTGSPFHRLGKAVVSQLPGKLPQAADYRYYRQSDGHPFALTLNSLAKAGARELLDELLPEIPDGAWILCDAAKWKALHKAFGTGPFAPLVDRLMKGDPEAQRQILYPILAALISRKEAAATVRDIAARLVRLKPMPQNPVGWDRRPQSARTEAQNEVHILLSASFLIAKPADRAAMLKFVLADRSLAVVREVLAPVLLGKPALAKAGGIGDEVLGFSIESLEQEISRDLNPFPDWTRSCPEPPASLPLRMGGYPPYGARENHAIRELAAFMADPSAETRVFRHPQDLRNKLESFIATHALDLDHVTIRQGSPHGLSCTKNDKSHHRTLARRTADEALLVKLCSI